MYTGRYAAADGTRSPERSLTSVAYDELKRRLLMGEFRLGQRLGEVALAEQLAVSRTPVREALTRLHAEGFVVRLPEGGFSPAAPDLHTIAELYVVRRGLELTALFAPDGHDRHQLEDLRAEWAALDRPAGAHDAEDADDADDADDGDATPTPDIDADDDGGGDPSFVLLDEDFHIRMAAASGNRSLTEMLARVSERIRIIRTYDFLTSGRIRQTIDEHLSIVSALIDRELKLAERRLNRHLRVSREIVERRSAAALSRMVYGGSSGA